MGDFPVNWLSGVLLLALMGTLAGVWKVCDVVRGFRSEARDI